MDELMEQEILAQAVQNLNIQVGYEDLATVQKMECRNANGDRTSVCDTMVKIKELEFACEIKRNVTNANFNAVLSVCLQAKEMMRMPFLLVAQYIYPALSKSFAAYNINVLDRNGNCCINEGSLFLYIRGEKSTPIKEKVGRAFQEAGLKLIFFLLTDKKNVNLPYRTMQQVTGLSLGTIKTVIENLIQDNYVLVTKKGRFLKNRKELLGNWVTGYNKILKPKRLLGRMTFISNEKREQWMNMKLPQGMTWSGECAVYLKDGFLVPGGYEIYTKEPLNMLLRTGYVMPKEDGEIAIYEMFWNNGIVNKIPELVVYADLMGSGNSRCLEAAQRIIKDEDTNIK